MSAASLKEKATFAVSVAVVIILISYGQKKWGKVPGVGDYLPGGM